MDCHAFLAPYECHTIFYMKDLIDGSKKFIHQDKVRHLSVPQYEGLGIREMIAEAEKYPIME